MNYATDFQAATTNTANTGQQPLALFEASAVATLDAPWSTHDDAGRRCEPRGRGVRPLAPELRPRTRLRSQSPQALSAAELLAIVLGGEQEGSLGLAAGVISRAGSLAQLRAASYEDLTAPGGARLSEPQACKLLAAIELGKRLVSARDTEPHSVSSPEDIYTLLGGTMADLDREHFVAVLLDTKNQVIGYPTISVGTLSSSLVHPREVFKPAIKASAASVILAHNHPSAHLQPSEEDRRVTQSLVRAGETIGIEVLDHVILGARGYVSLKEMGLL